MPFRVIELALEVVLEAMRGQTAEQKQVMWGWFIEDIKELRAWAAQFKPPEGSGR